MTVMHRSRHYLSSPVLLIIAAIAIGIAVGGFLHPFSTPARSSDPTAPALAMQQAFINVVDTVKPAVVNISTEQKLTRSQAPDEFFDFPFPFSAPAPRDEQRTSLGSGVIMDKAGYVLTADHVVEDVEAGAETTSVKVTLNDGEEYQGTVVGTDPVSDLAVIKIDPRQTLVAAPLGDGGHVQVGQWVLAMGSPLNLGYEASVTAGIISATGRGLSGDVEGARRNMIQTDAAINSGNSGGPLVNLNGEIIGINRAIVSPNRGNVGIGFAIALDDFTRDIISRLKKGEKIERGRLGVHIQDLTSTLRKAYNVESGVYVPQVLPDSAAAQAGIKADDIIVEFNGQPVTSVDELVTAVQRTKPGTDAQLVVVRDGKRQTLTVKVGAMETPGAATAAAEGGGDILGLTVDTKDIDRRDARRYGWNTQSAVVVTNVAPDGLAGRAGIDVGDVVISVNRHLIRTLDDYTAALDAVKHDGYAILRIGRRGDIYLVQIPDVHE
jgi:Do/DeqQ family serine protease